MQNLEISRFVIQNLEVSRLNVQILESSRFDMQNLEFQHTRQLDVQINLTSVLYLSVLGHVGASTKRHRDSIRTNHFVYHCIKLEKPREAIFIKQIGQT